jgi:hypothetical protein
MVCDSISEVPSIFARYRFARQKTFRAHVG